MRYVIKWADLAQDIYDYGSQVTFTPTSVIFENPQMPPSFRIKIWRSLTNFQGNRVQPTLPLLTKGKTYQLTLQAQQFPNPSVYLKISYYDRFGALLSFEIIKEETGKFTYPTTAFSYTIELINTSCQRLVFEQLVLRDDTAIEEVMVGDWKSVLSRNPNTLSILLLEPDTVDLSSDLKAVSAKRQHLVYVPSHESQETSYLSPSFETFLNRIMDEFGLGPDAIDFISYGPIGNFFGRYYASRFQTQLYTTGILADLYIYKQYLARLPETVDLDISMLFEYGRRKSDIVIYFGQPVEIRDFSLVLGGVDFSHQLRYLPSRN